MPPPPRLRSDAVRNRERILTAAKTLFARVGMQASVEDIAREAGVGVGTLYRRFPDRTELIEAVFLDRGQACLDLLTQCLAQSDAWQAFHAYVTTLCAMQEQDRSIADVLTLTLPPSPAIQRVRTGIFHAQNQLIARARTNGGLRPDFTGEDVATLLLANAGIIAAVADKLPTASARFVALHLDSLRTGELSELPAGPTPEQMLAALQRPVTSQRVPVPPAGRPTLPLLSEPE
ncbi:helix-turn-helix domain-containing protein [Actinoplanes sp. NPDC049596]|uniref:TetR/AcrR family transcriptional regulator n=1 Tax=unclassified Actinoplanes TaxID=2626549 RepID=UPI00343A6767